MYESKVWQAFHTRSESDEFLGRLVELSGHELLGPVFEELADLVGAGAWEDEETRDK